MVGCPRRTAYPAHPLNFSRFRRHDFPAGGNDHEDRRATQGWSRNQANRTLELYTGMQDGNAHNIYGVSYLSTTIESNMNNSLLVLFGTIQMNTGRQRQSASLPTRPSTDVTSQLFAFSFYRFPASRARVSLPRRIQPTSANRYDSFNFRLTAVDSGSVPMPSQSGTSS